MIEDTRQKYNLFTQDQCLQLLGNRFRTVLTGLSQSMTDIEIGRFFLERYILVHASSSEDKLNILCLMVQKLYAIVDQEYECDNLDSLAY